MSKLIEEQCRYLEEQAARIGVDVEVAYDGGGYFTMRLRGGTAYTRVRMEDKLEDFHLKAWKLLNGGRADHAIE